MTTVAWPVLLYIQSELERLASLRGLDIERVDDEADRAVMADERDRFDEFAAGSTRLRRA